MWEGERRERRQPCHSPGERHGGEDGLLLRRREKRRLRPETDIVQRRYFKHLNVPEMLPLLLFFSCAHPLALLRSSVLFPSRSAGGSDVPGGEDVSLCL